MTHNHDYRATRDATVTGGFRMTCDGCGFDPSRQPIRIPCEGSNCSPTGTATMNAGICAMCGVLVTCRDDGTTWPHDRNDILAMLDRGDFDA